MKSNTDLVSMYGDKDLEKALNRIQGPEARKAMKRGMRVAMKTIVLPAARANIARNFGHRSVVPVQRFGKRQKSKSVHLVDTLKVRATRTKRGAFGIGVRTGTKAELGLSADEKGYYPVALEYGWYHHNAKRRIPARPYMRPALWDNMNRVINAFGKETFLALRKMFAASGFGGLPKSGGMAGRKSGRPRA